MPLIPQFRPSAPAKVAKVAKVAADTTAEAPNFSRISSFSGPAARPGASTATLQETLPLDAAAAELSHPAARIVPTASDPDPAAPLAAYFERVAICTVDGCLSEADAHAVATEQVGASLEVLARRQIELWQQRILAMPTGHPHTVMAVDCLSVIDAAALQRAVMLGWDETALFGVHPVAPLVRVECWGLLAGLVLSPHNRRGSYGQRHQTRLVEIDVNRARTETPTGARFGVDRLGHGRDEAVPVWELAGSAPTAGAA